MGLGKTLQTISLIAYLKDERKLTGLVNPPETEPIGRANHMSRAIFYE